LVNGYVFCDSFKTGDLAGLAIGQLLVTNVMDDATQTNFEAFYNFLISREIRIMPLIQVVTHPGNRDTNGTIVSGAVRTVFSF
jgi:porin